MRAGHGKRRQHADTDCADAYLSHMVDKAGLARAAPPPPQAVVYDCNCHVWGAVVVQYVDTLLGEYIALQADMNNREQPRSVLRLQTLFGSRASGRLTKLQPCLLLKVFRRCICSLKQRYMLLLCCLNSQPQQQRIGSKL
jgi:hypothetical protein